MLFRTNAPIMVNHSVKDELTTEEKSCALFTGLDLILMVAWPAIQEATNIPIAFDNPSVAFHKRCLEIYDFSKSGKPIVNSVAASRTHLDEMLEIAVGHGRESTRPWNGCPRFSARTGWPPRTRRAQSRSFVFGSGRKEFFSVLSESSGALWPI